MTKPESPQLSFLHKETPTSFGTVELETQLNLFVSYSYIPTPEAKANAATSAKLANEFRIRYYLYNKLRQDFRHLHASLLSKPIKNPDALLQLENFALQLENLCRGPEPCPNPQQTSCSPIQPPSLPTTQKK